MRPPSLRENTPFRDMLDQVARPKLREALQRSNVHALPRIRAVVVAAGVGKRRAEGTFLQDVEKGLMRITGQKPVARSARGSIAGFKVREGSLVGYAVTLRGRRMEDFLTRMLRVALPRVRDFRGLSLKSVDARGNLTIGISEAEIFPEIDAASIPTSFGFQITMVTTAKTRAEGQTLFRALGFPFSE